MKSLFNARRPTRIAIIDDHQLILQALSSLLANDPQIEVAGVFSSPSELLKSLSSEMIDMVLMDYELGEDQSDGAELIKKVTTRFPGVSVLMISAHYNPATVALALRRGAKGFVGKNGKSETIKHAIHEISRGRIFIEEAMAQKLAEYQRDGALLLSGQYSEENVQRAVSLAALSPKEQEVIRCFIRGMTVTDISEKFNRSLKTISGQKQSAMRKLGLKADHELFIIKDELLKSLK
ncbi:response regulator [Pantoea dispersa]|uniref:response regulator n=1 Tax=Pantoea dispersa TaxID=59814 RepID=UPI0039B53038